MGLKINFNQKHVRKRSVSNTCRNTDVTNVKFQVLTQFRSDKLKLKIEYLMKHCIKSGIKNHFRSSKYDTNSPLQKLRDKTTQSFRIFKWQNRTKTAFLEVEKYEEIEKSLWHIIFRSVTKHFPKIFFTNSLCVPTSKI